MVEIRYGENYEVANLAGQSVAEAREQFKAEFGISGKARARINDNKVKGKMEAEVKLADNDKLSFTEARAGKGAFLVGALLLALSVTGGVFAYGLTTASTDFSSVTASGEDFAEVSSNTSSAISWTPHGKFKGTTGGGTLFDVDTQTSGYNGKSTISVSIANGDELVSVYRTLAMFIKVYGSHGDAVDINGDGNVDSDDFALLTLSNGAVDLFLSANATGDYYTVKLDSGFYATNIKGTGWVSGYEQPLLYAEVAQR